MVDGILGSHGLDGGENRNPWRAKADLRKQINDILNDIALDVEVGKNIDRSVGNEEGFAIGRYIHDEHMANPTGRTQTGFAGSHFAHELVGVQAALHQELAFGFMNELDRLCRRRLAVWHVDNS